MSGTIAGGQKAAKTNKEKYGKDFYRRMGSLGGQRSNNGGFASTKVGPDGLTGLERAAVAGRLGGRSSSRKGILNGQGKVHQPKQYLCTEPLNMKEEQDER